MCARYSRGARATPRALCSRLSTNVLKRPARAPLAARRLIYARGALVSSRRPPGRTCARCVLAFRAARARAPRRSAARHPPARCAVGQRSETANETRRMRRLACTPPILACPPARLPACPSARAALASSAFQTMPPGGRTCAGLETGNPRDEKGERGEGGREAGAGISGSSIWGVVSGGNFIPRYFPQIFSPDIFFPRYLSGDFI